MKKEIYISVDIEASDPIAGEYNMFSIGAAIVGKTENNFYIELKPINDNFVQKALDVCNFSMKELKEKGVEPAKAMKKFEEWILEICKEDSTFELRSKMTKSAISSRPVFVAFNATFDWSFVNYYFHRFLGKNPFGISGLDVKAYYMGLKKCKWGETVKRKIRKEFPSNRKHTHNALDDAIEQAEIFEKMLLQ